MYLLSSIFIAVAIFRNSAAQIQTCALGYAVLVPCCTTSIDLTIVTSNVYCPSGCMSTNLSVFGTDIYTENTSICLAAIHAGIICNGGGYITVQKMPGQATYTGSTRNGITSLNYTTSTSSFTFPSFLTQTVVSNSLPSSTISATATSVPAIVTTPYTTTASTIPATVTSVPAIVTTPYTTTASTIPATAPVTTTMSLATTTVPTLMTCYTDLDMLLGDPLVLLCPSGCNSIVPIIWGTDMYTSDSDLCPSAIHAGVISSAGGYVTVKRQPLQQRYIGSYKNGITSYSAAFPIVKGSYVFL